MDNCGSASHHFSIQDETVFAHFINMVLGLWLLVFPFTVENQVSAIDQSQWVSGGLVVALSLLSLHPKRWWAPWCVTFVGIWLQLSPLVFWAPNPATYLNDSVVGVLLIVFSVMIPKSPKSVLDRGPEIPLGWSYNPSSWTQRIPVIFLGLIGWLAARYMAAFQLGYIESICDPVFGDGTKNVLHSDISKSFPVSDAGLGAVAYILEALLGCRGGTKRWHQMPWSVVAFGVIVIPLGLISIALVILQPIFVGHWCFWCILIAFCMLIMISLAVDELVLVIQHLRRSVKNGARFWPLFWKGGGDPPGKKDDRSPFISPSFWEMVKVMKWGINFPANLNGMVLVGAWLMAAPKLIGISGAGATNLYILGPYVIAVATVAFAEVARAVRFFAIPLGVWVLLSSLFLGGYTRLGVVHNVVASIALVTLSIPKGKIEEKYGDYFP